MAMRETVTSLKTYLILAGVAGGLRNLSSVLRSQSALEMLLALVGVVISVAFLYVGLRLRWLLTAAPHQALTILLTGAAYLVGLGAIAGVSGALVGTWLTVAIGLLVIWYLYVNVRRLAAEARLER